jgi:hypothetical protein
MAKLYKSYNELQHQYNQKRKMVIELGITAFLLIALAIGLISCAPKGIAFVCAAVAVTAIAYAQEPWRGLQTLRPGIKGEIMALNVINRNLPDSFAVFHSIEIQANNRRGEIDIVVVSLNGVFLIEVKNYLGIITGCDGDGDWLQTKITNAGKRYENCVRNPVTEVNRHKQIFSRELLRNDINVPLIPLVFLVNPKSRYHISSGQFPIFTSGNNLCQFIINYRTSYQLDQATIRQLETLLCEKQKMVEERLLVNQ